MATARKPAAGAPAASDDAAAKAAAEAAEAEAKAAAEAAEAKAAEEAAAAAAEAKAAAEAEAKAAAEAEAKAAAEAEAQAQHDDEDEEYAAFLASVSLRTAVHVQVDDRYQPFPAGTKVGDVVNGIEFSEELAATVTNPKAWVIPTQAD